MLSLISTCIMQENGNKKNTLHRILHFPSIFPSIFVFVSHLKILSIDT